MREDERDGLFEAIHASAGSAGGTRRAAVDAYIALMAEAVADEAACAEEGVRTALVEALPPWARLEGLEHALKDEPALRSKMAMRSWAALLDPFVEGGLFAGIRGCCLSVCDALRFSVVAPEGREGEAREAVLSALPGLGFGVLGERDPGSDPLTLLRGSLADCYDPGMVPFEVAFHDEPGYTANCVAQAAALAARSSLPAASPLPHAPVAEMRYFSVSFPSPGPRGSELVVRVRADGSSEVYDGRTASWVPDTAGVYLREVVYGTGLARAVDSAGAAAALERLYGAEGALLVS